MRKFSKVLAVTDLSEASNRSIAHAYALVEDGGTVHLVHVLEHDPAPNPLYAHYSLKDLNLPDEQARARAAAETRMRELVPPNAQARHIATQVAAVVHPEVSPGIVTEAKKRHVDAIVMGTQGRSGLERLVLGSVANRVIMESPVPVLVVPPER